MSNEYGITSDHNMERWLMSCQNDIYNTIADAEETASIRLVPCSICGRTFAPATLEKHLLICEKSRVKKRKVFDSSRQRREGTELASYPLPKLHGLPPLKPEKSSPVKNVQTTPSKKTVENTPKPAPNRAPIKANVTNSRKAPNPGSARTSNQNHAPNITHTKERPERARPSAAKMAQQHPSETCPHCERRFGVKAFDRHVEWCKEKALIASMKQNNKTSKVTAKERLEARTKYRAPCLKTKRSVNRDKYSSFNDDGDDPDLMDDHHTKGATSMASSMTSSFMSEGGLSDNYDPFLSAKRQLEELCSPSSPNDETFSSSHTLLTAKSPSPGSSIPSNLKSPSIPDNSITNPRRALTTVKSSFRRTSSLRTPRRSPLTMPSRSIFYSSTQNRRPTIQRGLSDEGPISSSFLKPEEYDEMPVRSVCVNDFAISNSPRVIRRDSSAAPNRKNLRIHIPGAKQDSKESTPTPPVGAGNNNNLSKTDSLAVFLKYENEAKNMENPLINTKELKDKSNTLSKQNSAKSVIQADDLSSDNRNLEKGGSSVGNFQTGIAKMSNIKLEPLTRPVTGMVSKKLLPCVVSPIQKKPIKLNLILDSRTLVDGDENDFIDPNLINVCDNLSMDLSNDSPLSSNSSATSSSSGHRNEHVAHKVDYVDNNSHLTSSPMSSPNVLKCSKSFSPKLESRETSTPSSSNRNSNTNMLKRKIRLGRNQFLYDASPENETPADHFYDQAESNHTNSNITHRSPTTQTSSTNPSHIPSNMPPFSPSTFDEFNFEEFLSSFQNEDEQFPSLFKDCREFLMNRTSLSKRSNIDKLSSYRSNSGGLSDPHLSKDYLEENLDSPEDKNHGEIFISIETDRTDNDHHTNIDPLPAVNPQRRFEEVHSNENKFRKIEDDDDIDDNQSGMQTRRLGVLNDFPNVKLNNAKNLVQQFDEGEQDVIEEEINGNNRLQHITEKSLYSADSVDTDEISSGDCYNVHRSGDSGNEGPGCYVQSKHSVDSAYGSLSRPSTSEVTQLVRQQFTKTPNRSRPTTASQQEAFPKWTDGYRNLSISNGSSSSGSDVSLPPLRNPLKKLDAQSQSKMNVLRNQNSERKPQHRPPNPTPLHSQQSQRFSKFCHECGNPFVVDHAKFCMDCGVRRILL